MGVFNKPLNYDKTHSHRWADHIGVWEQMLKNNSSDSGIYEVCYERKKLPSDIYGKHYTPLKTSIMYAVGMDRKMKVESNAIDEIFGPGDPALKKKVRKDTDNMMGLFITDAKKLLKGSKYSLDGIIKKDHSKYSYSFGDDPGEWEDVLNTVPCDFTMDNLVNYYIRGRFAQEYHTLEGAVKSFHLIKNYGYESFSRNIGKNAEAIAWQISGVLQEVMDVAGLSDKNGMETDHTIKDNRDVMSMSSAMLKPTAIHRKFGNCPIYSAYSVVDEKLGKKNGGKVGFAEGKMDFCRVCENHGKQAVDLYVPKRFNVISHKRRGKSISEGGSDCDFVSVMRLTLGGKGKKRKKAAEEKRAYPPKIKKYS